MSETGEESKKRSLSPEKEVATSENNEEPVSKKAKKRSPDLAKFWKAVEDDPADFTSWTYLLQFVDTTGEIEDGREAYDAFLFRYPYCYGYWKKYADLEKRKGAPEKVMMVFERGIKAISLSADLWIHYLNHVRSEFGSKPDFVRAQYERAVDSCGKEWKSDKFWDHYVKWEIQMEKDKEIGEKNYAKVIKLYERILQNPTQGLNQQFDMFKEFVKEHEPKDLFEPTEFLDLRKEILASLKKETESGSEAPLSEEETSSLREKIISTRKKIYKATDEKVQLRWKYEDAIKRPYFHVKPLERGQLKNWSEYLDFEEKQGDKEMMNLLFERAMIACALYEEFWMKYVNFLLRSGTGEDQAEKIRDVYNRACTHHLPEKVDIHLNWAAFEESKDNYDKAKEILENLQKKHPELMSVTLRLINLERRAGHNDSVESLYKTAMEKSLKTNAKAELAVKFSRFLRLNLGQVSKAREILNSILKIDEKNAKIHMQLLDIEMNAKPFDAENVIKVFDTSIATKGMPARQKLLFSQRKIEFLEDFGTSTDEIQKAKVAHEKLMEEVKKESKKEDVRGENPIETIEGRSGKSKTSRNGDSSTTYAATNSASYTAAHTSSYNQYGSRYSYGNYGQYYQGYYQS